MSLMPERIRKMQLWERKRRNLKTPKGSRVVFHELNGVEALEISLDKNYQKEDGVILYLHGGGYVAGSPWLYKPLLRPLSKYCDMPVMAVDYRMAPDHVFPAGLDDSIAAYKALLEKGYQSKNIFIMGDSAGGNLTLATILKIKQEGLPNPAGSVSISPWADMSCSGDSVRSNEKSDSYIPGYDKIIVAAKMYAGETPLNDPLLSPVFADFSGMAPMKIIVGDIEVLYDDSRRVAEKASEAGVEVDYKAWRGQSHVFPLFSFLPEAKQALREIRDFVNAHKPKVEKLEKLAA